VPRLEPAPRLEQTSKLENVAIGHLSPIRVDLVTVYSPVRPAFKNPRKYTL